MKLTWNKGHSEFRKFYCLLHAWLIANGWKREVTMMIGGMESMARTLFFQWIHNKVTWERTVFLCIARLLKDLLFCSTKGADCKNMLEYGLHRSVLKCENIMVDLVVSCWDSAHNELVHITSWFPLDKCSIWAT